MALEPRILGDLLRAAMPADLRVDVTDAAIDPTRHWDVAVVTTAASHVVRAGQVVAVAAPAHDGTFAADGASVRDFDALVELVCRSCGVRPAG